jgi:hypothetical protein
MKTITFFILFLTIEIYSQLLAPAQSIFMQGNNINAVFRTDGYFNCDKTTSFEAGFIWPVTSPVRLTAVLTSGIWIGAKVGVQRELRLAASFFNTHYSPGNIPVIGQVPPASVCSDPSWRGYYVQLTDPALFNGGSRIKTAGGRPYTFNYDSWASWPVQKGAPYVEVNGIPGYQPAWDGDRPGIGNGMTARPEELLFMVYMDYTNCTDSIHSSEISLPGGTLPLGVEIHQLVFSFNCFPLRDMYFVKFWIKNKSSLNWDSVYFSLANEPDIGDTFDDLSGCDSTRDLGFVYNFDNLDPIYGNNPPALGTRFLQSPVIYTGSFSDTLKLPYDTLLGYKQLGMTSYNKFLNSTDVCAGDPDEAFRAYYFMQGLDGCGNQLINWVTGQPSKYRFNGDACQRTGWYDSISRQQRYIQNSGPFTMNSGDTQIVVLSYMITRDGGNNFQNVCALQSISDSALYHYYNDFKLCIPIGIQPISTEIPQTFALFQNYPNPFNPATKIRFNIPLLRGVDAEGRRGVLLNIYDALGREIEILVNEELNPGTYEVEWNAEKYSSGIYFYRLTSGDFSQTRKLVLVK